MKKLNPYIQKQIKKQMLLPVIKCEMHQAFCRFAIPGYCLEGYKQYACEFLGKKEKEVITFGERKLLLSMWKDEK